MYYGNIKNNDIADGEGIRVSLFVSGCRNCCKGCFNEETWKFNYGQEFTQETLDYLLTLLNQPQIQGISLLGGDPFEPENVIELIYIMEYLKKHSKPFDTWCWTGYTIENLVKDEKSKELLKYIDIICDGRFILEKRDLSLKFRGSSNQRILKVKEYLNNNKIVYHYPEDEL